MAKKPVKKKEVVFIGYVRTQVDKVAKDWVAANLLNELQMGGKLIQLASDGYKVSLQWRDEDAAFVAGLYCGDSSNSNAGLMLTSRHNDALKAFTLLVYLHEVKYDGTWPDYQDSRQDTDW